MATVQQRSTATASTNGDGAIRSRTPPPVRSSGRSPTGRADEVAEIVARARAAQPAWEALGFEGRARILAAPRSGSSTTANGSIETIVSETGKTYEDAQLAEISYVANSFGFWAKHAPEFLADEKIKSSNPFVAGPQAHPALPSRRRGRRHRAVELPALQLVRRLHPGAGRGQRRASSSPPRSRR